METSGGRRFCGAPHLCSAYARATLAPAGNDVEMEVNLASTGVSERRILTPSADRMAQRSANPANDDAYQVSLFKGIDLQSGAKYNVWRD